MFSKGFKYFAFVLLQHSNWKNQIVLLRSSSNFKYHICRYFSDGASCIQSDGKLLKERYEELINAIDMVGFTDKVCHFGKTFKQNYVYILKSNFTAHVLDIQTVSLTRFFAFS